MRKLLFILMLLPVFAGAQKLQDIKTYGLRMHRMVADTLAGIPSDTFAVPTALRTISFIAKKGSTVYTWNTSSFIWEAVSGAGATYTAGDYINITGTVITGTGRFGVTGEDRRTTGSRTFSGDQGLSDVFKLDSINVHFFRNALLRFQVDQTRTKLLSPTQAGFVDVSESNTYLSHTDHILMASRWADQYANDSLIWRMDDRSAFYYLEPNVAEIYGGTSEITATNDGIDLIADSIRTVRTNNVIATTDSAGWYHKIRNKVTGAEADAYWPNGSTVTASQGLTKSTNDIQLGSATQNASVFTSDRYINTNGHSLWLTSRTTSMQLGVDSSIAGGAAYGYFKGPYGGQINYYSDTAARTFNGMAWYKQGVLKGSFGNDVGPTTNHFFFDASDDVNGFLSYNWEWGGLSHMVLYRTGMQYFAQRGAKRAHFGAATEPGQTLVVTGSQLVTDTAHFAKKMFITDSTGYDIMMSARGTPYQTKMMTVPDLATLLGSGGMTNPMTNTGDVIYSSDNSGTPARLGIGSNGQSLVVASGLPAYARTSSNRNGYHYWNDFMSIQVSATGTDGTLIGTVSGASAGALGDRGLANRPGIMRMGMGTTTTGRASINSHAISVLFGGGAWTFETDVRIGANLSDATDTYANLIGFFDTYTGVDQVDAAYFLYDSAGTSTGSASSDKWQLVTCNNSARTFTTTTVSVSASTFYKLRIEVNAAASSIEFFINDVSAGTHITNIPTATGRETAFGFAAFKSAGTNSRFYDIDFIEVESQFTSAR